MTSPAATPASPGLSVRTTEIDDDDPLLTLLPADGGMAWLRRDEGLIGYGVAAEIRPRGMTRFSDADKWWTETVARADIQDDVNEPGTGLVSFGSFAFADDPGDVGPHRPPGRGRDAAPAGRGSRSSATRRTPDRAARPRHPRMSSSATARWTASTGWGSWREAVRRITSGALGKVVLARDLVATAASRIDVRWPLHRLAESYPMCWTFHVDGLFGATPEMLVRRERGLVTSRVLAGTIRRTGDDERDLALAAALARSSKDHEEHEYAVRSVADALEPHCSSMIVPETPFVLHLPERHAPGLRRRRRRARRQHGVVAPAGARRCTRLPPSAARRRPRPWR